MDELHEKYKSKSKMAPELRLLLTLGGSAFMFHLTNNIFKSAMPQFESMVGNNPNIINNMMNKGAQGGGQPEAPRPQPSKGMGGMGGMGGLSGLAGLAGLGGLGGLGVGGAGWVGSSRVGVGGEVGGLGRVRGVGRVKGIWGIWFFYFTTT